MSTNVKTKTGTINKQRFIRITLDPKLEKILSLLQEEFPLLDNIEIIKMLISIGFKNKQKSMSFKQILSDHTFLDIETEDEQFEFLRQNGLMK
jgi:lipid II:glycine glycyltransferase (peptidoglycan interpeptide bridge formation enzyme)